MTAAVVVLTAGSLVGSVLLVGACTYGLFLWPSARWTRPVTVMTWTGWCVASSTTVALLAISVAQDRGGLRGTVATLAGTSLVVRLALLCLAFSWLHEVNRTYGGPVYRGMSAPKASTGAGLLVLLPMTFGSSDAPVTGSWPVARAVLTAVHADALTLWLGGLVVLAAATWPRDSEPADADALERYAAVARAGFVVASAAILLLALARAGGIGPLVHSHHLVLAVGRVAGLGVVLGVGGRVLYLAVPTSGQQRTEGTAGSVLVRSRVRRSDLVLVVACVLVAAAVFVVPA